MVQDLTAACRSLLRRPALTIVAALTLAVGVGAATAIFSVVYGVLIKPLDFPESDRLVRVWELTPNGDRFSMSGPDYADFAAGTRSFTSVAAFDENPRSLALASGGDPIRIGTVAVSASFFDVLQTRPALGRPFTPDEDRPGETSRRIVISHALWRARFGSSPSVIDSVVSVDREKFLVTGVMPPGFSFPSNADAWVPVVASSAAMAEGKTLGMIGRLREGVTIDQARADLRGAAAQAARRDPDANAGWSADAAPFQAWLVPARFRQALMVLSAAIGCLLLLACANVANLLLAHTARRQGELRLRAALGARRGRLVRLLFSESALLAALGTTLGLVLARWIVAAVRVIGEGRVPRLDDVALQTPALAFAAATGLFSCIVFGIAPALHGSHMDLRAALDQSPRFTRRGRSARGMIAAIEVALAMVLLTAAGLLTVSFARLASVDPGFATANLLAVPVELQDAAHDEDAAERFLAEITNRISAIPGVQAAGATSTNPFRQFGFRNSVTPEEARTYAPPSGLVQAGWRAVTPGFFSAAGLPLIEGRAFAPDDRGDDVRVVMISQSLARQLWPSQSAVGHRILWGGLTGRPRTVIGVTGDIKDVSVEEDAVPMLFVPHAQVPLPSMTLLVRGATPERLTPLVRAALREVAPAMPPPVMESVDDNRARASSGPRFNAWLFGSFALIAAGLAASGIYAMLAFAISERRREIAVRLVLGARPAAIVKMVFGEGARMTLAGLAAGLIAAALLTRYLESLLFEVRPSDPIIFAAGGLALVALATAASLAPAWQASRIDPLDGLRMD